MSSLSEPALTGESAAGHTELLLASMERAPVAMAVVDGENHSIRYQNAAFRALDAAPVLANGPCRDRLDEARRSEKPARVGDLALERDGGTAVWDVDFAPLGEQGVLVTIHDVSAKAAALREKEVLLREVNHRVKNSLQLVSSLLTLQALSSKEPEMRRQFQEACGRIGTVAQVHQRLYQSETYSEVAFGQYLRDLCRELGGGALAKGRAVTVDADDIDLSADAVIPLALVVNELVCNALKYAYADGEAGEVAVEFRVLPDGAKRLSVADRGRGLPAGYEVARADTLGMKVVRAFAGQLKGKFRAEPAGPGARFVIDLPA